MIARYTRPELSRLWSDDHRYDIWLRIELAACEEMEAAGTVPRGHRGRRAGQGRRQAERGAHPRARGADAPRRDRLSDPRRGAGGRAGALAAPGHDVIGRAGRGAGDPAVRGDRPDPGRARQAARRLPSRARRRSAPRRPSAARTASTPSRSPPAWCSPASSPSSGARGARWSRRAPRSPSARSPARSAPTPTSTRRSRRARWRKLGLRPEVVPTQIVARDRHAAYFAALARVGTARRTPGADGAPLAAHRGRRGDRGLRQGTEGLVGDAAQEEPDPVGEPVRAGAPAAQLRARGGRERRAVARARHLALVGRAGDRPRRDRPVRLHGPARGRRSSTGWWSTASGCGATSISPAGCSSARRCCCRWCARGWRARRPTSWCSATPCAWRRSSGRRRWRRRRAFACCWPKTPTSPPS